MSLHVSLNCEAPGQFAIVIVMGLKVLASTSDTQLVVKPTLAAVHETIGSNEFEAQSALVSNTSLGYISKVPVSLYS